MERIIYEAIALSIIIVAFVVYFSYLIVKKSKE